MGKGLAPANLTPENCTIMGQRVSDNIVRLFSERDTQMKRSLHTAELGQVKQLESLQKENARLKKQLSLFYLPIFGL